MPKIYFQAFATAISIVGLAWSDNPIVRIVSAAALTISFLIYAHEQIKSQQYTEPFFFPCGPHSWEGDLINEMEPMKFTIRADEHLMGKTVNADILPARRGDQAPILNIRIADSGDVTVECPFGSANFLNVYFTLRVTHRKT